MNTPIPNNAHRSRQRRVTQTTVFQSGNSQAIRIPKEFQFQNKRVEILRDGRNIVLRPLATTAAEAVLDLPALDANEAHALARAMAQRDDLPALDEPTPARLPTVRNRSRTQP